MTPVQYVSLAYAFATILVVGYSARLWLACRATRTDRKGARS
jgi:hypothetical protein